MSLFRRVLLAVVLLCIAGSAFAQSESYYRFRRDPLFFQEGRLMAAQWVNPAAADTATIVAGVLLDSVAVTTVTFADSVDDNFGQLDNDAWARTVQVTIASRSGTAADVAAGTLTITGTNILGATITEAFAITNNTENTVAGTKAFRSLTSFTCTAMDDDSVGISIGPGVKLGLLNTLPFDTMILASNGTSADASAAFTVDDDEIEKNVVDFNTDPSGTSDHSVLYWIPPFASTSTKTFGSGGRY